MCGKDGFPPFTASEHNVENRSRRLLRLYPEVVSYLLKKFATDQAIAEFVVAILRYMQQTTMKLQQYADYLLATSCKVAVKIDEGTLIVIFREDGDPSITEIILIVSEAMAGIHCLKHN